MFYSGFLDRNSSFSLWLFPSLSTFQEWTPVLTTALATESVMWGTPLLLCTASAKITGRGKPVTSRTAWLTAGNLKEAVARIRPASVQLGGKVGLAAWREHFSRCATSSSHMLCWCYYPQQVGLSFLIQPKSSQGTKISLWLAINNEQWQ